MGGHVPGVLWRWAGGHVMSWSLLGRHVCHVPHRLPGGEWQCVWEQPGVGAGVSAVSWSLLLLLLSLSHHIPQVVVEVSTCKQTERQVGRQVAQACVKIQIQLGHFIKYHLMINGAYFHTQL